MTIKVYSSIMPGDPDEVYEAHGLTVEEWVKGQTEDYKPGPVQPISCSINGSIVKPDEWADTVIGERDNVEFRVVPRGDTFNSILAVINPFWGGSVIAGQAALDFFTPTMPGQPGQGSQGQNLDPAQAKANTARLGQGVSELMGYYIRYVGSPGTELEFAL